MIEHSKRYPGMKPKSSDNFQTDPAALDPLMPYLRKKWLIWEPAQGDGNLVKQLELNGWRCIGTDLKDDPMHDFMRFTPLSFYDCIVTNPPYSIKDEWIERCYDLRKPFALLLPMSAFDAVERRQAFAKGGVEVILPSRRFNFTTPNTGKRDPKTGKKKRTSSWFYTAWFTHGLKIGRQLTFTDHL